MISLRGAHFVGVSLGLSLALACRDAPTSPALESLQPTFDLVVDSVDQFPPPPRILNPYTELRFTMFQGHPLLEIRAGMEYQGNRASMLTHYSVRGEDADQSGAFSNEQDATYNPTTWKRWDVVYPVEITRGCGWTADANTEHLAWWSVYVRILPEWRSQKAGAGSKAASYTVMPCERREETTTSSAGTGNYITITTCWYWLTISAGRVVAVEFDYCESTIVPVDENSIINQM